MKLTTITELRYSAMQGSIGPTSKYHQLGEKLFHQASKKLGQAPNNLEHAAAAVGFNLGLYEGHLEEIEAGFAGSGSMREERKKRKKESVKEDPEEESLPSSPENSPSIRVRLSQPAPQKHHSRESGEGADRQYHGGQFHQGEW